MNFFTLIGRVLGLVAPVTEAITTIADAVRPKARNQPLARKHHWAQGDRCAYCGIAHTLQNETQLCPAVSG